MSRDFFGSFLLIMWHKDLKKNLNQHKIVKKREEKFVFTSEMSMSWDG